MMLLRSMASLATLIVAGSCANAQSGWTLVVDQPENPTFTTVLLAGHGQPGQFVSERFQGVYRCWEDINEDSSQTAPWTTRYAQLYLWAAYSTFQALADQYGNCVFEIRWEDSRSSGRNGIEKWRSELNQKHFQRRTSVLHPSSPQSSGTND